MSTILFVVVLATLAVGVFLGVSRLTSAALDSGPSNIAKLNTASDDKPPLPDDKLEDFKRWFEEQRAPAIALVPDPGKPVSVHGSRLGGPAWIETGKDWPVSDSGVPMEFIAQLDCADCQELGRYPEGTIVQFFVARDDLFGMNFDNFFDGKWFVHVRGRDNSGALMSPPQLEQIDDLFASDYSPFQDLDTRQDGVTLRPEIFTDRMADNIDEAAKRIDALIEKYDCGPLFDYLDGEDEKRRFDHHTGGYPAYVQNDVRRDPKYAELDQVLLRLTYDDHIMWGDAGEAVFLMRSSDLARGDFSRVAYSWDCG